MSMQPHRVDIMIAEQEVQERIKQLGEEINEAYKDSEELVLVGLLRGSYMFMADLSRHITVNHEVDFMTASSYGNKTESNREVKILKDLDGCIKGKDVLIVEDIIDTGYTLTKVTEMLKTARGPKSIRIATLLDKPSRREVPVDVTWVGFEIPDEFVVGVGIDYAQKYRNLPYIGHVTLL